MKKIEWHKVCIKNMEDSLLNDKKKLVILEEDVKGLSERIKFYKYQIECAKIDKKTKFDRGRYKVKRFKNG